MSTRRNSTLGRRRPSGGTPQAEDVEMTTSAEEMGSDAEAEHVDDNGQHGMYETISRLVIFLCEVSEECVLLNTTSTTGSLDGF